MDMAAAGAAPCDRRGPGGDKATGGMLLQAIPSVVVIAQQQDQREYEKGR